MNPSLPILNLSHIDHKEDVEISVEIIVSSKDSILSYKRVEKYKAGNKINVESLCQKDSIINEAKMSSFFMP